MQFIITGTDTGVGKTVACAMLTLGLEANYWKPIQSGVEEIDTRRVQQLTELTDERFFPERYVFTEALSPHRAAELDNVKLDLNELKIPASERPLIIEGAGGLLVPMTRKNLQINLFRDWDIPVILCARTELGTINHTLLSVEAMWNRRMRIHGLIFIGEKNADNMRTISDFTGLRILGRLPILDDLNAKTLQAAFDQNFSKADFRIPRDEIKRIAA